MNKKILLVAGGSGGHLFPALSIINSLKKFNTVLLTDHRAERYVKNTNINYKRIITARLKFNFFFILNLLKLILSIFQNLIIITKHKPDLVIGFGGYTSIPSLIAAKLLRKKIIIHEQNAVMGKTNRLLSKFADVVATSFTYTKYAPSSAVHTGIPLRKKGKIRKIYSTKKRIFVVGGSQGAAIFSKIVPSSLEYLSKSLIKKIVIVQQARIEDIKLLKNFYSNLGIKHEVKSFFEDIYFQYYNSDLVISRCGASTLAEIEFFSKKSILFPLPTAMNNHQYLNAMQFKKNNECLVFNEERLKIKLLSKKIENLIFLEKKKNRLYNKKIKIQKTSLMDLIKK